jgi:hypothetical protein
MVPGESQRREASALPLHYSTPVAGRRPEHRRLPVADHYGASPSSSGLRTSSTRSSITAALPRCNFSPTLSPAENTEPNPESAETFASAGSSSCDLKAVDPGQRSSVLDGGVKDEARQIRVRPPTE